MDNKSRMELFGEAASQLDCIAREAHTKGSEELAEYIEGLLTPFIEDEEFRSLLKEWGAEPLATLTQRLPARR
jgi:hypothetical protein